MSKDNNDRPAFPVTSGHDVWSTGMSLRDWFAGQALVGINSNPTWDENGWKDRAREAYHSADAMLKEREK